MISQMISAFVSLLLRIYSHVAISERGSFRLVRVFRKLIPKSLWQAEFNVGGGRYMILDISDYPDCCMAFGLYELTTARLIKRILRPGDHFIDGGANIGYFTMMAAKAVGEEGKVDAFEPQPNNRERLKEHLQRNRLDDRVTVHALALGRQKDEIPIHFYEGEGVNHGCSSIYKRANATVVLSTVVEMKRMDEVVIDCNPKLVKLDIEGAEYEAILGMEVLLRNHVSAPHIVAECNYRMHASHGASPERFVAKVLEFNPYYEVYLIRSCLERVELDRLSEMACGHECNLYFKPPNR